MRKKDYELIAGAVYRTRMVATLDKDKVRRYAKGEALALLATDLTATLAHDNPKFDGQKFLTACGIKQIDNRECWTCHKAVGVCGHSQPV